MSIPGIGSRPNWVAVTRRRQSGAPLRGVRMIPAHPVERALITRQRLPQVVALMSRQLAG